MTETVHVLLVEDDSVKAKTVTDELTSTFGAVAVACSIAPSVAQAMTLVEQGSVDLLIVDLSLPLREGSDPMQSGGLRLLERLDTRRDIRPPAHVVGLTAYSGLAAAQSQYFADRGWVLVPYDPASDSWAAPLRRKVAHIIASKSPPGPNGFQTDLCLITALDSPELDAVLKLPGPWQRESRPGDVTVYHHASWDANGRPISVVTASASTPGMPATAALAMKMIYLYRPRFLAMCGIAAGIGVGMGDVLVADQLWDYGSGKILDSADGLEQFAAAPAPLPLDQAVKARIACFVRDGGRNALGTIEDEWSGEKPKTRLSVHVGPLASGAAVIASQPYLEKIKKQQRKVIGVEMEAYAIGVVARFADEPRPIPLIIKSVSDLGDKDKSDAWQHYAAHTSSRFLYHLMRQELMLEAVASRPATLQRDQCTAS